MPGVIRDPKQNPGNEKKHGILYMPEKNRESLDEGYYYYIKSQYGHDRYYTAGTPIVLVENSKVQSIPEDLPKLFDNREIKGMLNITIDPSVNMDKEYPMVLFLTEMAELAINYKENQHGIGYGRDFNRSSHLPKL